MIAGDITISLVGVDLLNIKLRLLIASVDKAKELGINWWETDPNFGQAEGLVRENQSLRQRLDQFGNEASGEAAGGAKRSKAAGTHDEAT